VGLPPTAHKVDSIWVIVDHFTKSAHFIPMHTRFTAEKYAENYIAHILFLHGVPKTMNYHMVHSSAYHQQMNYQIERVNQILEDMLRACVMEN
jgi:protoheme ferro-lyase